MLQLTSTRLAVTIIAEQPHCSLASTKLYCTVTEACVNNLPRVIAEQLAVKPTTYGLRVRHPNHQAMLITISTSSQNTESDIIHCAGNQGADIAHAGCP